MIGSSIGQMFRDSDAADRKGQMQPRILKQEDEENQSKSCHIILLG